MNAYNIVLEKAGNHFGRPLPIHGILINGITAAIIANSRTPVHLVNKFNLKYDIEDLQSDDDYVHFNAIQDQLWEICLEAKKEEKEMRHMIEEISD